MTKNNAIKSNASTKKEKVVKRSNEEWEQYFNTIAYQMAPANHEFKKRLGIEMVEWAKSNPRAVRITQFLNMKGIGYGPWYKWIDQDPDLNRMHKTALSLIADRRELGALERTYDPAFVKHTMPMFDEDWKKHEEWRASLNDGAVNGGTKIVVLEKFGNEDK